MKLTQEQKLVEDMVRKFAKDELQPVAAELDKVATFPQDMINKLSELGFMGIMVPEKYGGAVLDTISYCIIIEELAKALASIGFILVVHNGLVVHSILKYGNDSQKDKWLPSLAPGDTVGAFGLNEEGMGYDFSKLVTRAEKSGDEYIISGNKYFVPNAEIATLFIIFANVSDDPSSLTAFLVERGMPGFEVNEKEDLLGMRAAGICNLKLNQVKVSADAILGGKGNGIRIAEEAISFANLGIASLGVGICQASLEDSLRYSKERHQFGRPICEFQLIQEMLVEMKVKLTQSKLLVYEAASNYDTGEPCVTDITLAKLCATDSAMEATTKAIQVHGGYGYTKDYPVERYFRDAKVSQIWGGTSTYQKSKIGSSLFQ